MIGWNILNFSKPHDRSTFKAKKTSVSYHGGFEKKESDNKEYACEHCKDTGFIWTAGKKINRLKLLPCTTCK